MSEFSPSPEVSSEKAFPNDRNNSPVWSLFSFLLIMTGGYILFNVLSPILVSVSLGISLMQLAAILQNPGGYDNAWQILMLVQVIAFSGSFLITPLLYMRWMEKRPPSVLNPNRHVAAAPLLAVALLVVFFVPFNDLIIQWNNALSLPEPLRWIELWMKNMEEKLQEMTQVLTNFSSPGRLLIGFLVIAVLPAIGEELTFRGLLQNKLQRLTGNAHVAIWMAAVIFSSIHFQFYGFFPRMLLGALFGYLYVWSGSLWLPILAHFVNNAFTLLMVYLYQQKVSDFDVEKSPFASWPLVLLSLALTAGLLYYIRQYYKNRYPAHQP
jgi:uncharacterized protein